MEVVDYKKMRLTVAQKKSLAPVMGSWRSVHVRMRMMDESIDSLKILAAMLAYELQTEKPRHQLITRIHMRINAIRQRMEYAMAIKHAVVVPEVRVSPVKKLIKKLKPAADKSRKRKHTQLRALLDAARLQ